MVPSLLALANRRAGSSACAGSHARLVTNLRWPCTAGCRDTGGAGGVGGWGQVRKRRLAGSGARCGRPGGTPLAGWLAGWLVAPCTDRSPCRWPGPTARCRPSGRQTRPSPHRGTRPPPAPSSCGPGGEGRPGVAVSSTVRMPGHPVLHGQVPQPQGPSLHPPGRCAAASAWPDPTAAGSSPRCRSPAGGHPG
jgi:hypothetical protein